AVSEVGIITNAGTAHLELLGSVENIARAKCELLKNLDKRRRTAILGHPTDILLAAAGQVYDGQLHQCLEDSIEVVSVSQDTTSFRAKGADTVFEVRVHGRPLLEDAWCAIMAARHKG